MKLSLCTCCGAPLEGARTSRWGLPFCWTECERSFAERHYGRLDEAVDEERVRRGLRPIMTVAEAAE